jgi:DNA-binding transcriptional LysR family regulator
MVEADMGVGIVPLHSAREDVEKGRLVRWWIEGAQINWEFGIARLSGGYESPVMQTFTRLTRKHFGSNGLEDKTNRKVRPAAKPKAIH